MNQMDFVKLFEYNKGRDYVFYECGITHKNIENGFVTRFLSLASGILFSGLREDC